jgi:hypothetical protein
MNRILKTTMIPGTDQKALPHFMVFEMTLVEMTKGENDWISPVFSFDSFVSQGLLANVVEERKQLPDKTVNFAQIEESAGKSEGNREDAGKY